MTKREQYIKPSLLLLDYDVDKQIVTFGTCKSNSNDNGRGEGTPGLGESCASSFCVSGPPGAS